ncbi:HAD-IIIA family hydrolase [Bacteroidales bacterium OttesenSCG-928-C19]|nr:HAD-IIIA family hydrolase [Bacteroidales bacterium OttesenSCG-928-C19]
MTNYKANLHKIKAFIFDFDGVMTDGSVWTTDNKEFIRCGNVKDGYAIQYAVKNGYKVAIISGGNAPSIRHRMETLGVTDIFLACSKKLEVYHQYLKDNNLTNEEVLYMGDDIPDYEVMQEVGVPTCPADAVIEIQEIAHYISHLKGGSGCVRDVIEQVMRLHQKWFCSSESVHW